MTLPQIIELILVLSVALFALIVFAILFVSTLKEEEKLKKIIKELEENYENIRKE